MRKGLTLMLCLIGMAASIQAQTLSGKLVDEKNVPLAYANVVLLSIPDSTFVSGTISDEMGGFRLAKDKKGQLVRISSIGYATIYKKVNGGDFGVIQMASDAQLLGEVVVKSTLPTTRLKGDAMITGVTGTVLEQAGTAEMLLDKIPNVSARDGAVNVFGRGTPVIYINGRKVRNNAELDQLTSDNIKSVEVINNPGARYDASVKAVIRIITKKAQGEGFGFSNSLVGFKHRFGESLYDQFNFNYRAGGFDLTGMLSGGHYDNSQGAITTNDIHSGNHWRVHNDMTRQKNINHTLSGILSMNYQFNADHAMGVRYQLSRDPKIDLDGKALAEAFKDGTMYEQSDAQIDIWGQYTTHNVNAYYNGKVNGWSIDLNLDGMWDKNKQNDFTAQTITGTSGGTLEENMTTLSRTRNNLLAGKLVISRPLWGGSFSFGSEYSHNDRTNQYRNEEGVLASDDSEIKEGMASGFLEYGRSFGKLSVQAGVRYEHVGFDYYDQGKHIDEQSKTYDDVFPSLALSLPMGKVQTQLVYGTDISRPSYMSLRSNITYVNRYLYETGDPYLLPTRSRSLTFASSYQWLSLVLGYQHVMDAISQLCDPFPEKAPSVSLYRYANIDDYDKAFASLTLAPKMGIWQPQLTLSVQKQWYTANTPDGKADFDRPLGSFQWQNTFSLSKTFNIGVNASLQTKGHNGNTHFDKANWLTSLSAYKSFCKGRFITQLFVYDLFQSSGTNLTMYNGGRTMKWEIKPNRSVRLTLRYVFNQAKSKYKGTGAGESQKARM